MSRGLIIPAVPFLPLVEQEFEGLADFQGAVNGYIEPVPFADPAVTLFVNEEGKRRHMSLNERATVLWWLLTPSARGRDLIVGDAVLLAEGGSASVLIDQVQRQWAFRVEVKVSTAGDDWLTAPGAFLTWFDAAKFALALEQRFDYIEDVRVAA